jgi:voltage-gated potassium channel
MDLSPTTIKKIPPILVATLIFINGLVNIIFAILPSTLIKEHDFSEASRLFSMVAYQQASSILTVIVGFILISLGIGLYNKRRSAWLWSIVMLLLLNIENIYPSIKYIPLLLGIVSLVILLIFHKRFRVYNQVTKTNTTIAWLSVTFAMGYGAIGSYLLRDQFRNLHSFSDSVYYTLVTYSTVGYGDITPVTNDAKLFVVTMIFIGIGAFATVFTVLIGPLMEKRLKKVFTMVEQLNHLRGHAIFSSVNQITLQMARDMKKHGIDALFIETDVKLLTLLERQNYNALNGEATDMHLLKQAAISDAKYFIAAEEQDAQSILTVMTVKKYLNKHVKKSHPEIVIVLQQPDNASNAEEVGADRVIIPALLASQSMFPD